MEAMRSALDATTPLTGMAFLDTLSSPQELKYPTPNGQLLDVRQFGEELIEPTTVADDLPRTGEIMPLLIDGKVNVISMRGIELAIADRRARVVLNCFLAFAGQGWFNSKDVSLALVANDVERVRFSHIARQLDRKFQDTAGTALYLDNGLRTIRHRVQTNPNLVPISMKLIRDLMEEQGASVKTKTPKQKRERLALTPVVASPEVITPEPEVAEELTAPVVDTPLTERKERIATARTARVNLTERQARKRGLDAPRLPRLNRQETRKILDELGPIGRTRVPEPLTTPLHDALPDADLTAQEAAMARHRAETQRIRRRQAEDQAIFDAFMEAELDGKIEEIIEQTGYIQPPRDYMTRSHPANDDNEERRWQDYANCLGVDPDLFFPERGASTKEAKQVCQGCVVKNDCLEYALSHGEKHGIWGGASERERRRIRRQRALARSASNA